MKKPFQICDALWAEAVKKKAGYVCEYCGAEKSLQAHHIISRVHWPIRYDLENGVCLCRYHHLFWAHREALEFLEWIKDKRDLEKLKLRKHTKGKLDFAAIEIYLTNL